MTIGKTRDHFDQWEAEDTSVGEDVMFDNLLNNVKDYARKQKIDGRGSAIEVGAVEKEEGSVCCGSS